MPAITHTFSYRASPQQVYGALTRPEEIRRWWSEVAAAEPEEGGTLAVTFQPHGDHATFRVERLEPGRLVRWHCVNATMLGTSEWEGTTVTFQLKGAGGGTELTLRHDGWNAHTDCFTRCTEGWRFFVGESLRELVERGGGRPVPAAE